ncbi:MAG: hypothetical protein Kow0032_01070 [Methyloligellaceae bacterium]
MIFFAFVGLAAYISYNAMFLQKGPHPAPFSADVDALSTGSTKVASDQRSGRAGGTQGLRRQQAGREMVRAVQRELAARGYQPGPADGVHGVLTRAAVMAYQHDSGLQVTGEISDALLKHILLGKGAGPSRSVARQPVPEETVAIIKAVQQILAQMGYDPGPVDGIMGAATRKAIRTFEEEQKMPPKGRISGALISALVKATGARIEGVPSG